jgi:hypothetical protein
LLSIPKPPLFLFYTMLDVRAPVALPFDPLICGQIEQAFHTQGLLGNGKDYGRAFLPPGEARPNSSPYSDHRSGRA